MPSTANPTTSWKSRMRVLIETAPSGHTTNEPDTQPSLQGCARRGEPRRGPQARRTQNRRKGASEALVIEYAVKHDGDAYTRHRRDHDGRRLADDEAGRQQYRDDH